MIYKQQFEAITHCPITKARMKDPIIAPDGIRYERSAYTALPENKGKELIEDARLKERLEIFSRIQAPTEDDYQAFLEQDQTEAERQLVATFSAFFNSLVRCPITGKIMKEPVITPDGFCYEKVALDDYLSKNNHKTPEGILIRPEHKSKVVIPNDKLRLKINEFLSHATPGISNSALLGRYIEFFNDVAVDAVVDFALFADPIVVAENLANGVGVGGIQGASAWNGIERSGAHIDPVALGRLPVRQDHTFQKIAYLRLQQAMVNLQIALENIRLDQISQAHHERLQDLDKYKPFEFEAQDSVTLPEEVIVPPPARRRTQAEVRTMQVLGRLPASLWTLPLSHFVQGVLENNLSKRWQGMLELMLTFPIWFTIGGFLSPISSIICLIEPRCDVRSNPVVARGVAQRELFLYPLYFGGFAMLGNMDYVSYIYYPIVKLSLELASGLPAVAAAVLVPLMFFNFAGLLASLFTYVGGESARPVLQRRYEIYQAQQAVGPVEGAPHHAAPATTRPTYLFWAPASDRESPPADNRVPAGPVVGDGMRVPLLSNN